MSLDFAKARENMLDSQVRTNDVTDIPLQDAMGVVARERFCPPGLQALAYAEAQIEYAPGYRLMEPRDTAKLLQAIYPRPGERALAIAAPYAAAVLARMGLSVTALLPQGPAEALCRPALTESSVAVEVGSLQSLSDLPDAGYAVLVCEGAVTRPPAAWIEAIGPGGRLGVIERSGRIAVGCLYSRGADGLVAKRQMFHATAALMPGFEPNAAFAF